MASSTTIPGPEIIIRNVTPETFDADLAQGFFYPTPPTAEGLAEGDIELFVAQAMGPDGPEPRGNVAVDWLGPRNKIIRDETGPMPGLAFMNVRPPYRGQGIGSMLIQRVFEEVQQRRVPGMFLVVEESNVDAQRLYGRFQFAQWGLGTIVLPRAVYNEEGLPIGTETSGPLQVMIRRFSH